MDSQPYDFPRGDPRRQACAWEKNSRRSFSRSRLAIACRCAKNSEEHFVRRVFVGIVLNHLELQGSPIHTGSTAFAVTWMDRNDARARRAIAHSPFASPS